MSNGHVFTESGTAAPIQLEKMVRAIRNVLAQWGKDPQYMGLLMELIPYLAEKGVQSLDRAYVQGVSDWKLARGGCLSDETYIKPCLEKIVRDVIEVCRPRNCPREAMICDDGKRRRAQCLIYIQNKADLKQIRTCLETKNARQHLTFSLCVLFSPP